MALTIVIHSSDAAQGAPELALTFDSTRIAIGRGKSCDLWLPDLTVAKRHASIRREGGKTLVVDEGSVNGIVVDRVKLPAHAPSPIAEGSLVRVGRLWLEIRQGGGIASTQADVRRVALALVRRELVRQGEPATALLDVVGAKGPTGDRLALEDQGREYVVGRGRDADLSVADELASRRHIAVSWRGDGWRVRDLGSKQGSFVRTLADGDGTPLETPLDGEPRLLRDGEFVRLGTTLLRLVDPVAQAFEECIDASELKMRSEEFHEPPPRRGAVGGAPIEAPADPVGDEGTDDEGAEAAEEEGDAVDPGARLSHTGASALAKLDALVVLVALGLLALSALGLVWVLR